MRCMYTRACVTVQLYNCHRHDVSLAADGSPRRDTVPQLDVGRMMTSELQLL